MRSLKRFAVAGCLLVGSSPLFGTAPAFAQASVTTQRPARGADSVLKVLETVPTSPTFARIQSRTYDFKEAGVPMNYELFVPTSYDASKPTPLVVALHCLSSYADEVIRYEGLTEQAEARGFVVVAPMGFNNRGWYGSRGPGRASERGDAANDPANLGELSELDVMNVLAIVRKEFNIDPKRMFLMGHSMGGGGTFYLGPKHPELWAALAVAAPAAFGSPDVLASVSKIPIVVVQGDQDTLVDVKRTRLWVAKMKELGIDHTYIEVAGGDHMHPIVRSPQHMKVIFDVFAKAKRP